MWVRREEEHCDNIKEANTGHNFEDIKTVAGARHCTICCTIAGLCSVCLKCNLIKGKLRVIVKLGAVQ
jgi:hypothetical protein